MNWTVAGKGKVTRNYFREAEITSRKCAISWLGNDWIMLRADVDV
jgi:hypothetical protein